MYIFIVNPASRSGHASQIWTEIETLLKERNISLLTEDMAQNLHNSLRKTSLPAQH